MNDRDPEHEKIACAINSYIPEGRAYDEERFALQRWLNAAGAAFNECVARDVATAKAANALAVHVPTLQALHADLHTVLMTGHLDNTGAECRIDLDGHHCCYTCNRVEAALKAYIAESTETP